MSVVDIARSYEENGYYFPLDVLTVEQAENCRARLETLEAANDGRAFGNKGQMYHAHVLLRFVYDIVRNDRLLDAVEKIIGPDIMVWGTTFFIKEPHSDNFVSWHQDLRYWGLDGDALVSGWVAFSPATLESGCMQFAPKSHRSGLVDHNDTFRDENILTRGQEAAVDIDENATTHVELQPGQASLHHGYLLHASTANNSNDRRIGLTIQYMAPNMRQVVADTDFAMLVRGEDRHGHFEPVPPPEADMTPEAIAWHARIMDAQNDALYDGAETRDGALAAS